MAAGINGLNIFLGPEFENVVAFVSFEAKASGVGLTP
jgi:hypothetical protein